MLYIICIVQWLCNHRNLSIARWSDIDFVENSVISVSVFRLQLCMQWLYNHNTDHEYWSLVLTILTYQYHLSWTIFLLLAPFLPHSLPQLALGRSHCVWGWRGSLWGQQLGWIWRWWNHWCWWVWQCTWEDQLHCHPPVGAANSLWLRRGLHHSQWGLVELLGELHITEMLTGHSRDIITWQSKQSSTSPCTYTFAN